MNSPTSVFLDQPGFDLRPPLAFVLPDPVPALVGVRGADIVHGFRPAARRLEGLGLEVKPRLSGPYATICLFPPKEMDWAKALVAECLEHLEPGGVLALAAPNDAGGRRWPRLLGEEMPLSGSDSRGHQRLVWLERPDVVPAGIRAWRALAEPRLVEETPLLSAAGMFSHGEVDPASRLLAENLPPLRGRVADLGAGWGYLSWAVRRASPDITEMHLYEADSRALALAERNVSGAVGHWHDVTAEPLKGMYDAIITNPPFHAGKKTDPDIGRAFISRAAAHLVPGGVLWLVANRQLPYEDELINKFKYVSLTIENNKFKVFQARV